MSWSVWNVAIPGAGAPTRDTMALVLQAIKRTGEDSPTYLAQFDQAEVRDQLAAASAALDELIASGACGSGPWTANLSGHVNPGHVRREGYGTESITVTLVDAMSAGSPMATGGPLKNPGPYIVGESGPEQVVRRP